VFALFVPFVQFQEEGRQKVREALTLLTMQSALQRVLPFTCRKQYTVVTLMPKSSCWASMKSLLSWSPSGVSRDAKVRIICFIYFLCPIVQREDIIMTPASLQILTGVSGALVLAVSLWRYSRSSLRS
jgi:hypothetical protein